MIERKCIPRSTIYVCGIFVQYKRGRFCALTNLELNCMAPHPNVWVIILSIDLLMRVFSNKNHLGFVYCRISTAFQNKHDLGSDNPFRFPMKLNPWHGDPTSNNSIFGSVRKSNVLISPNWIVFGKFALVTRIAYLSISHA